MIPECVERDGGLKLIGTTAGSVPATASYNGGMAMSAAGELYVVFL